MGKLPVHIAVGASLVQYDRIEIRPGNDDQVPLLQAHVGIEIGRQKTAGFISLDAPDEHERFSRVLPKYLINIQLIGGVGEIDKMLFLG